MHFLKSRGKALVPANWLSSCALRKNRWMEQSEGAPLAKEKIDLEIDHLVRPLIILTTTQHRMAQHG